MRKLFVTIAAGIVLPLAAQAQKDETGKDTLHYNFQFVAKAPAARTYTVALRALIDEGFRTADASRDAGVIQTEWKDVRWVPENANFIQRAAARGLKVAIALDVTILDYGPDSSRITITGREQPTGEEKPRIIKSKRGATPFDELGWTTLKKLGETIRLQLETQ